MLAPIRSALDDLAYSCATFARALDLSSTGAALDTAPLRLSASIAIRRSECAWD